MATATRCCWVPNPSPSYLLPPTTVKVRRLCREAALSITNRLLDSSKLLNAATATSTSAPASASASTIPVANGKFISCYAPDQPQKGADVHVESLERAGVTDVFTYPGAAIMEIHQFLTRSNTVRNSVCSCEQCEIFAAEEHDHVSGKPGVIDFYLMLR